MVLNYAGADPQSTPGQDRQGRALFHISSCRWWLGLVSRIKPNNVLYQEVGTISLEFDSCQSGRAAWRMDNDETGSFNLRRITTGIHGVPCQ